jgi:hypothetical protein
MEIGDKVKIIYSPYSCVKKGTIATIVDIKFQNYGKYWTMYILDTKPCNTFRIHEIEKIDTFGEIVEKVLKERHETWKELAKNDR